MILHPNLGVGLDIIEEDRRIKVPAFFKKVIARQTELESLGEELRVLYVAFTRAKEKLIITGCIKDEEMLQQIRETGELIAEEYLPEGIRIEAYVPPELFEKIHA